MNVRSNSLSSFPNREGLHTLPCIARVFESLPVPDLSDSTEGRAFSLAAELSDRKVASQSLQRLVCRHWRFVPLTVRGLALDLSRAIALRKDEAVLQILHALLDYTGFPSDRDYSRLATPHPLSSILFRNSAADNAGFKTVS